MFWKLHVDSSVLNKNKAAGPLHINVEFYWNRHLGFRHSGQRIVSRFSLVSMSFGITLFIQTRSLNQRNISHDLNLF